ncbi:MAG: HEPN domain-containing protein [Spirochaetaceae bacterium]|jgi:HEPN domain-containing protein|nr:HEPN domain-containing protein [Spirochaetaceae bacterium]
MNKTVAEWIHYADNDFLAAKILKDSYQPPYEIIAFHCQQAAEKYLKALYVNSNQPIMRTHDLGVLLEILLPLYPELKSLLEICDRLTPFGVVTRYPGSSMTVGESHMGFLMNAVEKMRGYILFLLGMEKNRPLS